MNTKARITASRSAPWLAPRLWLAFGVLAVGALIALRPAGAQEGALDLASAEELQEIVGPIALYPDDLVAIVLPASTYPLQVVQAARFLEDQKNDSTLQPNEEWDDSIVALLNYPEVVALLDDDLDWTYDLGTAVLNQRADVLSAIQSFRDEAYAAGNLRSDERQTVAREDDTIEIKPADPQVIYVPYYEPERVVVYQTAPVYYYYPRPYPVYYYPYPAHYNFGTGFFWGVNTWFSIGWHSHYVHAYDPFYYGHPYYGHSYYNPFYVRNVYVNVNHYNRYPNYVWQPKYRYGGRPVVRGSEGRVHTVDGAQRQGVTNSNAAATRTREGPMYRAAQGASATTARAADGTPQPHRGAPTSGYRNRSVESSQQQATGAARASPSTGTVPTDNNPRARAQARAQEQARAQVQAGQPNASVESSRPPTSQGTYRSSGGMAQARSQTAAQTDLAARPSPGRANPTVSARTLDRSTGMPREASRSAPAPRESAPVVRAPSDGGGMSAQRSDSGGSYRGNSDGGGGGNAGGGSYRGGGAGGGGERAAQSAGRASGGRSAGRER